MLYHSPYNPTEQVPEPTLIHGKKTYIFKDKNGAVLRTETVIDEETFDTTIHVQLYPIEEYPYFIEYNLLSPTKIKSKIYMRGNSWLRRIDFDKNGTPEKLTLYNEQNKPTKTLKRALPDLWEEKRIVKNGLFSKKNETIQYVENPKNGELMYHRIIRAKEEIIFDENGKVSKINTKDFIGNVIKTISADKYNIDFDFEKGTYTAQAITYQQLMQENAKKTLKPIQTPVIQPKANTVDKFDENNRIIERVYHDQNNALYKKETYFYDEDGYTKTSWHLKGTFWHKHGFEVRYDLKNEIVSADYYNDHNLVPYTPAANELKIYAENYENNSYLTELKGKLSQINVLKLVDLTKEAINQIYDMVRLNSDRFQLKKIKITNSFPQESNQLTIPFQNLESLDLSEANLKNLDKVVIPDTSTELTISLNKVNGPEIDFSKCERIEKLTLNLSDSPSVKTFIFPPHMKELNLSIDNVAQLECIDLSKYKDLKINFNYKGNPKHVSKKSYAAQFKYETESDKTEALKKLAIFAAIQNRKKKATKIEIKLHPEHPLSQVETGIVSKSEQEKTPVQSDKPKADTQKQEVKRIRPNVTKRTRSVESKKENASAVIKKPVKLKAVKKAKTLSVDSLENGGITLVEPEVVSLSQTTDKLQENNNKPQSHVTVESQAILVHKKVTVRMQNLNKELKSRTRE